MANNRASFEVFLVRSGLVGTALLGAVSVTWFVDFFQTLGEAGLESTERVCPYGLTNSI